MSQWEQRIKQSSAEEKYSFSTVVFHYCNYCTPIYSLLFPAGIDQEAGYTLESLNHTLTPMPHLTYMEETQAHIAKQNEYGGNWILAGNRQGLVYNMALSDWDCRGL